MRLVLLGLALVAISCGKKADDKADGPSDDAKPKINCTVTQVEGGAKITCPDGSEQIVLSGKNGTNGSDGANGTDGAKGEKGDKGDKGLPGVPGSGGVGVYDANDQFIAYVVTYNQPYFVFSDGKVAAFDFVTGQWSSTLVRYMNGFSWSHCYYTSTDCSGACYVGGNGINLKPVKNALVRSGSSWYVATGNESDAGSLAFNSSYDPDNQVCNTGAGALTHAYSVASLTSLPAGLTYPFAGPLYFKNVP